MSIKKVFSFLSGYWIHKQSTLPIGTDLFFDLTKRLQYGPLAIVFDVGANEGQTFSWIRHHQPAAKIYCFEPVQSVFNVLQKKTALSGNCVVEHKALGEKSGQKTIRLFDDYSVLNSLRDDLMNQNTKAKEETISIDTLDNYCAVNNIPKIDLLKIDTEGYELQVLDGASQMLASGAVSFIYCEVGFLRLNNRNTYFPDLCEYLAKKNYFFYGLYQVSDHNSNKGYSFGNALFVRK
ncbi:MAG: FkbM family methyltransferase [Bacteroidota bacterium]